MAEYTNFYESFYTNFLTRANGLPINSMWLVEIGTIPDIIIDTTEAIEAWYNLPNSATAAATIAQKNPNGVVIATGVKVVGDSIDVVRDGTKNTGYIQGLVGNGRAGFPLLNIAFVENNISFVDYVLRPWQVAVAHKSLKHYALKTDIDVKFLAKTGPRNKLAIRKHVTYYGCCPVNIDEQEYNYSGSDMYKIRQIQFAYTNYVIKKVDQSLVGLVGSGGNNFFDKLGRRLTGELERQFGKYSPQSLIDHATQFGKDLLNETATGVVTNVAGGISGLIGNAVNSLESAAIGLGNSAVNGANDVVGKAIDSINGSSNSDVPRNSTGSVGSAVGVGVSSVKRTTGSKTNIKGFTEKNTRPDDTPMFVKTIEQQTKGKPAEVDVNISVNPNDARLNSPVDINSSAAISDAVNSRPDNVKDSTDANADTVMLNTKLKYNLIRANPPMGDVRNGGINHENVVKPINKSDVRTGIQLMNDDKTTNTDDYVRTHKLIGFDEKFTNKDDLIKTHNLIGYEEKIINKDDYIKKGAAIPYLIVTTKTDDVPVR